MACTREEIRTEVWGQLTDHIDDGSLEAANVLDWFLDPAIEFPNPTAATNLEPLLINTKGSWADRPEAATRIPNLFLAADFVRTHTDLATMEGANEAARRAVNAILAATGSPARPCPVWKLREPPLLAPFRKLDELRWRLGRQAGPAARAGDRRRRGRADRHGGARAARGRAPRTVGRDARPPRLVGLPHALGRGARARRRARGRARAAAARPRRAGAGRRALRRARHPGRRGRVRPLHHLRHERRADRGDGPAAAHARPARGDARVARALPDRRHPHPSALPRLVAARAPGHALVPRRADRLARRASSPRSTSTTRRARPASPTPTSG